MGSPSFISVEYEAIPVDARAKTKPANMATAQSKHHNAMGHEVEAETVAAKIWKGLIKLQASWISPDAHSGFDSADWR